MMKKILASTAALGLATFSFAAFAGAEGAWINGDTTDNVIISNVGSAYVKNDVDVNANTGKNNANATSTSNGGSSRAGKVAINTGPATSTADVSNAVNTFDNEVNLGNSCECITPSRDGDLTRNLVLSNVFSARVKNDIDVKANTGKNNADATSTANGGSSRAKNVLVNTGASDAWATVDNMVNTVKNKVNL